MRTSESDHSLAGWPVHHLEVHIGPGGLEYSLRCPHAEDSSAACHTWREFDEDYLEVDDGEQPEIREVVHHEEQCIAVEWFDHDARVAVEDGYIGQVRDGLVSGPVLVHAANEDEFEWSYA